MAELKKENPDFSKVDITIIDEDQDPDTANQYDYYYVPTFYLNGTKIHEGVASKEIVRKVFEKALDS